MTLKGHTDLKSACRIFEYPIDAISGELQRQLTKFSVERPWKTFGDIRRQRNDNRGDFLGTLGAQKVRTIQLLMRVQHVVEDGDDAQKRSCQAIRIASLRGAISRKST